jgi:pyruvate/2-oxoglutarate dehydrogenase complex dihydrolipoamide acyltransferase (E2) component
MFKAKHAGEGLDTCLFTKAVTRALQDIHPDVKSVWMEIIKLLMISVIFQSLQDQKLMVPVVRNARICFPWC